MSVCCVCVKPCCVSLRNVMIAFSSQWVKSSILKVEVETELANGRYMSGSFFYIISA